MKAPLNSNDEAVGSNYYPFSPTAPPLTRFLFLCFAIPLTIRNILKEVLRREIQWLKV